MNNNYPVDVLDHSITDVVLSYDDYTAHDPQLQSMYIFLDNDEYLEIYPTEIVSNGETHLGLNYRVHNEFQKDP